MTTTTTPAGREARTAILPGDPPPRREGTGYALTDDQRRVLRGLIGAHPRATPGQVALMFRARTGRAILPQTARNYRERPAPDPGRRNAKLTDAERALLLDVARRAGPEYCRREIAREFAALAGRTIHDATVGRFLRRSLGLPRLRRGQGSWIAAEGRLDARIAEARARKLESARPDRSPRVGRAGRATIPDEPRS